MAKPGDLQMFEDRNSSFKDEALLTCHMGKLFYFHQRRNAWHRTTNRTYPPLDAFQPTFSDARDAVEQYRVQGSMWFIKELPVLVLSGQHMDLLILEINASYPLASYEDVSLDTATSIENVATLFRPRTDDSVVRLLGIPGLITPTEQPFICYRSRSRMPCLTWFQSQGEGDSASVRRLVAKIRRQLRKSRRANTRLV